MSISSLLITTEQSSSAQPVLAVGFHRVRESSLTKFSFLHCDIFEVTTKLYTVRVPAREVHLNSWVCVYFATNLKQFAFLDLVSQPPKLPTESLTTFLNFYTVLISVKSSYNNICGESFSLFFDLRFRPRASDAYTVEGTLREIIKTVQFASEQKSSPLEGVSELGFPAD